MGLRPKVSCLRVSDTAYVTISERLGVHCDTIIRLLVLAARTSKRPICCGLRFIQDPAHDARYGIWFNRLYMDYCGTSVMFCYTLL